MKTELTNRINTNTSAINYILDIYKYYTRMLNMLLTLM